MCEYKIYPMQLGIFPDHDLSKLTYNNGLGKQVPSPLLAFLIRGNGTKILVDTGGPEPERADKYHHTLYQTEDMKIVNALAKLGETPDSIDFIVCTHLHWDHVGSFGLFPDKDIYVQKREVDYALDPYPMNYLSYETRHTGIKSKWIDCIYRFKYVYGDTRLKDGITLVTLPGHSPGLQGVLVETGLGKYLIASDCIGSYEVLKGNKYQKHFIGAVHTSVSEYYDSMAKIEAMDAYILPGHDARVLEHECYPILNAGSGMK